LLSYLGNLVLEWCAAGWCWNPHFEKHGAQSLALGIEPERSARAASQRMVDDEVEREQARDCIPLHLTDFHWSQEFGDGRLSEVRLQPSVTGRVVRHDSNIRSIALVAAPGVRQIPQSNCA